MLEMTPFLKTFGKEIQITSGKRKGETFLAIVDSVPREFLAGKMRVKEKKAVLRTAEKETKNLSINNSVLLDEMEFSIESIDTDFNGMGILYINGDM